MTDAELGRLVRERVLKIPMKTLERIKENRYRVVPVEIPLKTALEIAQKKPKVKRVICAGCNHGASGHGRNGCTQEVYIKALDEHRKCVCGWSREQVVARSLTPEGVIARIRGRK